MNLNIDTILKEISMLLGKLSASVKEDDEPA
jgi:hypothetical protein